MGHTWENGSHLDKWVIVSKTGHTWKNGLHLKKSVVHKKLVTLRKMVHTWKKGSYPAHQLFVTPKSSSLRSPVVYRINHQPGWLASCNTGQKVISAHRSSPAHVIRPLKSASKSVSQLPLKAPNINVER